MRFKTGVPVKVLLAGGVVMLSACTSERLARDITKDDFEVVARFEAETTHKDERVSGYAECSSWFNLIPSAKNSGEGYFSDVGSLFSGLSPTQSLALRAAIADACRKEESDFLLLPQCEMTTVSAWFFYESTRCTVRGFPGKVVRLKQIPAEDRERTPCSH